MWISRGFSIILLAAISAVAQSDPRDEVNFVTLHAALHNATRSGLIRTLNLMKSLRRQPPSVSLM
jgi:hypothetical protein